MCNDIIKTEKCLRDVMYPESAEDRAFYPCLNTSEESVEALTDKAIDIVQRVRRELRVTCFASDYAVGDCRQYLSSIVSMETIRDLDFGESVLMFCPTGSGKTKVLENIVFSMEQDMKVVYLTNRSACEIQVRKDLLSSRGLGNIPPELIQKIAIAGNIEVMTYQKFARQICRYNRQKILLILDEVHCLSEDAVFSTYPQKIVEYLNRNLDNTIRIYVTATADDILDIVLEMELLSEQPLPDTITPDTQIQELCFLAAQKLTRIQHVYCMDIDWSYLNFKFYNPNDTEKLVQFIQDANCNQEKSLIYINDIMKGKELQEALGDCQHVYSDVDKRTELSQIAAEEQFQANNLVTTKVAENGLSLHDNDLTLIVAETWDCTSLQQIIGRARVNRRSPRPITILVPDYTSSDIGTMQGKIYPQLIKAKAVLDNPAYSLALAEENQPYVYYSVLSRQPVANEMAYETLSRQYAFLRALKLEEETTPHAFARKVLAMYGFDTEIQDSMFLDYHCISACKTQIRSAWDSFKGSDQSEDALKALKTQLKAACNETGAYGKNLESNIQISTVNDILKFADIPEKLMSKRTVYDFMVSA